MEIASRLEILSDQLGAYDAPLTLDQASRGLPWEGGAGEKRNDERKDNARQDREQKDG
jgi:hypothetical protein